MRDAEPILMAMVEAAEQGDRSRLRALVRVADDQDVPPPLEGLGDAAAPHTREAVARVRDYRQQFIRSRLDGSQGYARGGTVQRYGAVHAPKGGATIGGKRYIGGQFIPAEVVASATAQEKAQLTGGQGQEAPPAGDFGGFHGWGGEALPEEEGQDLATPATIGPEVAKQVSQSLFDKLVEQGKALAERGQTGKGLVGEVVGGAVANLPSSQRWMVEKLAAAGKFVEHHAMTAFRKAKELAVEVAVERGLPQEQAERTAKFLARVDVFAAWTVTLPAVAAVTGSIKAGKVASFLPMFTLAYIGASGARNPAALARAARNVITGKSRAKAAPAQHARTSARDDIALLLVRLAEHAGGDADWYEALLSAALDQAQGDLGQAVALADSTIKRTPRPDGLREFLAWDGGGSGRDRVWPERDRGDPLDSVLYGREEWERPLPVGLSVEPLRYAQTPADEGGG